MAQHAVVTGARAYVPKEGETIMSVAKSMLLAVAVWWISAATPGVARESASKVRAQAPLKSGPQVGEANDRGGFRPQYVAGPGCGGRSLCPV
jgi:hypothetical protein